MIKKHILNNGMRIMTEKIDYVKSISFGIWIKVGSVNESHETNGMSHFIEHMLFKGTENRTANEIAEETDNIGGQLNAFTSKECTCFYIKVLDENLEEAIDILSDMFFNSKFCEEEIKKEISVVKEEIKMYEDSPEDIVHDKISELIFSKSPLAYPILGTSDILDTYSKDNVKAYMNKQYSPYRTVISVAGNFDEDKLLAMLENKFSNWSNEMNETVNNDCIYNRKIVGVNKDLEQLHFCIANRSVGRHDELYYPFIVMNNIFGGTMSSKLFQEIREKRGLVYSIYSFASSYANTGMFGVYAGLAYNKVEEALSSILQIMENMKNGNISEAEFHRAKQQIKSDYILGLENTSSRMSSIGRRELLYNEILTPEEVIEKINNVKINDIIKVSGLLFNKEELSAVYTGNLKKNKDLQSIFERHLAK